MSFRNFVVFGSINLGNVARRVLCGKFLSSLGILWSKFLAVTAKKVELNRFKFDSLFLCSGKAKRRIDEVFHEYLPPWSIEFNK